MKATFGALFDLDGVLIDSETRYTEFWNGIERIYPTGIPNYAVAIKGTTIEMILGNYDSPQVRADIMSRLQHHQDTMVYELYPGVIDFLDSLANAGVPMAIVTSSDNRKMDILFSHLPHLRSYFSEIIDGSMVTRSKPHPEGYRKAAASIGMPSERCCVFEDSLQGLKAGRAAGGKVVAIATTYPRATVEPLADLTVDLLRDCAVEQLATLFSGE